MYGVPGGNAERGRTEGAIAVILPVRDEMTIVAGVRLLEITAREDARTLIGCCVDKILVSFSGGEGEGVG